MPLEILMPRLADTMTHGAVVAWRKREGDAVRAGETIAEIEADKTTVDLESPGEGTLTRILVPAGADHVEVGRLLAVLEQTPASSSSSALSPRPEPAAATPAPPPPTLAPTPALAAAPPPAAEGENGHAPAAGAIAVEAAPDVHASPLARSMARQAAIDLAALTGSGPGGRVVYADLLGALGAPVHPTDRQAPVRAPGPLDVNLLPADTPFDEVPHSRIRQLIAQRLGQSKRTIPHFYLDVHCRLDALLRVREELRGSGPGDGGWKPSLNDLAVRAAALALRSVPEANAAWTEGGTRRYRRVDLAVAVATEGGLVAPVLRDADRKGLAELAAELRDLAARAREGKLRPEELQGGTFTLSNLGMYGVDAITPIINPPQAGILGLGAAAPRPVAQNGAVIVATVMTATLAADHRVLDGHTGARFLTAFRDFLERPLTMML